MINLLEPTKNRPCDNAKMDSIREILGMNSLEFRAFICKFILNISPPANGLDHPYTFDDNRIRESVNLYVVKIDKTRSVLHMSIVKDYDEVNAIFSNPTKVFTNLLLNKHAKPLLDLFRAIETRMNFDIKIAAIVINDLSKLRYFDFTANNSKFKPETYAKDFLQRIERVFPQYITTDTVLKTAYENPSPKSLSFIVFKSLITPYIVKLVELIVAEEKKLPREKTVRFYSFQITSTKGVYESTDSQTNNANVEYENLEFLDMQEEKEK